MPEGRLRPLCKIIGRYRAVIRKSRRRIASALCLALIAAVAAFFWLRMHPGSVQSDLPARIDQPLPSLMVQGSKGAVDLKTRVIGKRCIIVFYSPSCKTCKKTLPALRPLPEELRLILVNVTSEQDDSLLPAHGYAERFYDRWRVLSKSFAAASLPVILFVDEIGILRDGIFGARTRSIVQGKLKEFAIHSHDHLQTDS
jgi:thiol-disulfide isomerase/thioredoxin